MNVPIISDTLLTAWSIIAICVHPKNNIPSLLHYFSNIECRVTKNKVNIKLNIECTAFIDSTKVYQLYKWIPECLAYDVYNLVDIDFHFNQSTVRKNITYAWM